MIFPQMITDEKMPKESKINRTSLVVGGAMPRPYPKAIAPQSPMVARNGRPWVTSLPASQPLRGLRAFSRTAERKGSARSSRCRRKVVGNGFNLNPADDEPPIARPRLISANPLGSGMQALWVSRQFAAIRGQDSALGDSSLPEGKAVSVPRAVHKGAILTFDLRFAIDRGSRIVVVLHRTQA